MIILLVYSNRELKLTRNDSIDSWNAMLYACFVCSEVDIGPPLLPRAS